MEVTPVDKNPVSEIRRNQQVQMICLMTITGILTAAAIYWLRPVLLPFVLALFFVCGLMPVLEWIEKYLHVGRWVSVTVAFGLGVALVVFAWSALWYSMSELQSYVERYQDQFERLLTSVAEWIPDVDGSKEIPDGPAIIPDAIDVEADAVIEVAPAVSPKATEMQHYLNTRLREFLGELSLLLMELVSTATTVVIFMLFLLIGNSKLSTASGGLWDGVAKSIRSYIVTKTILSVATGVAFGGVLWLFEVPFAFLFGMLAFLLHYIPHIGPIVAGLLPVPLIVLYPELGVLTKVLVIIISWAVQIISGNVIEPLVMGESFEMHPVAVMLALMFWGMIWGVAGMFLSAPITAAISMLLEKFEVTRGVSLFISGRLREIEHPTPKISLT